MENTLSKSEAVYRMLFDMNSQPMWVYIMDTGQIWDVNEAAIQQYEYSKEEFSNYAITETQSPDNYYLNSGGVDTLPMHDCLFKPGIYKHIKRNGDIMDVEIQTVTICIDSRHAVLVLAKDITASLAAERKNVIAAEKYRDIQKMAGLGYWTRNLNADISEWSEETYEIYGRNPLTFVPTYENLIDCFYPDDRYLLSEHTFLELSENGHQDFEHRIITDSGEIKWVFQRLLLQKDLDGNITGVRGIIQDITQMKKSDEKFKAIFDHTNDAILIGDDDGKCLDYNSAAVDMFGYSHEELSSMGFNQLLKYPDEKKYSKIWEKFLNGKAGTGTIQLQRKDCSVITARFNAKPSILPGVHLCIISDITRQVMQLKHLRASERRFKALIREGADLISVLDQDGNYLYVSDSRYRILGINPSHFAGKNAFDFTHPQDKEPVFKLFSTLSQNKQVKTGPFRMIDSDGNWRWLTATATNLSDDPAIGGIVVNSKEITEDVRKSIALQLSNDRYKIIMKASNEAIYDWDIENDRVEWGTGFQDVFGYDLSVYNNNLLSDNIVAEDKDRIEAELARAVQDKYTEMMLCECRYQKADKSVAIVEYRLIFLRNDEGIAIRAIGSLRDITAYKHSLLTVQRQNEKLKEIAYAQSHVVRAPLARIMGIVDLIQNYPNSESEKDELIGHISLAAHEFDQIVRDISAKTRQIV